MDVHEQVFKLCEKQTPVVSESILNSVSITFTNKKQLVSTEHNYHNLRIISHLDDIEYIELYIQNTLIDKAYPRLTQSNIPFDAFQSCMIKGSYEVILVVKSSNPVIIEYDVVKYKKVESQRIIKQNIHITTSVNKAIKCVFPVYKLMVLTPTFVTNVELGSNKLVKTHSIGTLSYWVFGNESNNSKLDI